MARIELVKAGAIFYRVEVMGSTDVGDWEEEIILWSEGVALAAYEPPKLTKNGIGVQGVIGINPYSESHFQAVVSESRPE